MRPKTVLSFVALLLATRVALLAAGADVHGYGEEFAKGAAARLILSDLRAHGAGTGIELWNTPYVLHEGGGTMATLARVAVFALVGPSVLANKLVALASTTLVLVALLAAARELFGVRAAAFAGLAFVFAPEAFLRFSLLSLGTHFEAAFFVLALLALGARIGEGRDPRARVHFALGVCAGLGAYASLIVLPAIVAALGRVVFQRGRELLGRAGACLVAGALVGAAPWIWMVRNAGLDAVRIRGANPTGGAADPVRALGILAERVFAPDASRIVLVAACAAVVLTGAWACARGAAPARSHAREFVYVGAFLALFLAAYASSGFALHPDAAWFFFLRATPAWIGVVLLVAGAAAVLEESGGSPRLLARAGLGVIVLVGIVDAARLALDGRPGAPVANLRLLATTQGYDWSEYLDKLLPRLEGSVEEKLARIARVDDDPARLDPDLAQSAFEHADASLPRALETLHRALGPRADQAITGLRFFVHPNFGHDPDAAFRALAAAPERDRPALAEAIGRAGLGPRFRPDRIEKQLERAVEEPWRERWLLGAGWRLYRAFPLRPDRAREFLARRPEEQRAALERGWSDAAERARIR
ncbi:MAG: hypothetical protein HZA53_18060 [Planctomycetes bacterium]|nr:hypothetical protein [Planctomycetota bacterium]